MPLRAVSSRTPRFPSAMGALPPLSPASDPRLRPSRHAYRAAHSGADNELGDLIVAVSDAISTGTGTEYEVIGHLGSGAWSLAPTDSSPPGS